MVFNAKLALRLLLDLTAGGLLLVGLAYYWLDNAVHELVGTAMFLLVLAHNSFHRRWYGGLRRPQDARRTLDKLLVACLLAAMVVLLATSVALSHALNLPLATPVVAAARRLHVLAAYWALVLVAVHIGIRWRIVLGFLRNTFGGAGRTQAIVLRLLAAGLAAGGIHGASEIGLGARLLSRVDMEWWDFSASTAGFFLHHIAVVGLLAGVAHYALRQRQPAGTGRVRGAVGSALPDTRS